MIDQAEHSSEAGTSVELFAGGGGLAMAVHEAGFRHLLLNEFAPKACETLLANQATPWLGETHIPRQRGEKWPLKGGPVQDLEFAHLRDKVSLLAGGPPCQPFSLGGDHKGHEDERNMFPEFFRALREIQPRAFICENVRGLLRPSFRPYFDYILNELRMPFVEREGSVWEEHNEKLKGLVGIEPADHDERARRYVVSAIPVNAADYGVPQVRHRVIIVGFRMDVYAHIGDELWEEKFKPRRTHSEAALFQQLRDVKSEYWKRHKPVPKHVKQRVAASVPSVDENDEGLTLQPWRTLRDAIMGDPTRDEKPLPQDGLIDYEQHPKCVVPNHIGWPGARIYPGHTPNLLDRPAKTVKAGVHGVPGGESVVLLDDGTHRYMTVRETARVMTFPDTWVPGRNVRRGDQMRQLGNAVPVLLGKRFATAVADALRYADSVAAENDGEKEAA
ncbi:DNA cytosine methyltransferase [Actinospica durhamensis]|uniref:DNA (cytosine-5-)-methyltransferase n=1 Tax=Actinospica durhamensis TaxID=1508375 RepID=A0A941ELT2_9ACTN|nr:DNA cytosine methyltransferase [Actinospica durhamensis]MBR7833481.1 DNA cytosine methyltransferase [Actinospica durhamensis]